jgi:hypothetical protein
MKYLLLLLLSCSVMACSGNKDTDSRTAKGGGSGGAGGGGSQKPIGKHENTTDYSVCGKAASKLKTPEGRWEMFEKAEGDYRFKIALEFNLNTLTLRQDCYDGTNRLTAKVTVPATYDQGIIKILADGTDTDSIAVDKNTTFACKATLAQGTGNYSFLGHCLELRAFQGREYLRFAPQ